MILLAAVDDRNGLMFNHRRQSQDRVLRERILQLTAGKMLWMSPYSAKQFADCTAPQLRVAECPLKEAGEGEYCFLESGGAAPYEKELERVILFHWNRRYPADTYLDIDVSGPNWRLMRQEEFPGHSHEKISMEVYDRA